MVKKDKEINKSKIKYIQYLLHCKFDIYKLKTSLIIIAGIALKYQVDLIPMMVCFWIKHKYGKVET